MDALATHTRRFSQALGLLGSAAVLVQENGARRNVKVFFGSRPTLVDVQDSGAQAVEANPSFRLAYDDGKGAKDGDAIEYAGRRWEVAKVLPEGNTMITLDVLPGVPL